MSESNLFMKEVRESAGMRLAVLFGSFFIMLLVVSGINSGFSVFSDLSDRGRFLISSVLQAIIGFCVPAYFLARFSSDNWTQWLHLNRKPEMRSILGVVLVFVVSLPAMEWLIEFNRNLHLPEALSGLEQTLRSMEEKSESTTNVILESHGIIEILVGVLVIGVITGFSEEMFFRGGLQGIFMRSKIGPGASVWLAAFIFSFMHFQFFGFLPRLIMGVFFGYLLVWTRSLWVPVFAHFLNNSVVVVASAFSENSSQSVIGESADSVDFGNPYIVVGSVVLTTLYLIVCRNYAFKTRKSEDNQWQKNQLPPVSQI